VLSSRTLKKSVLGLLQPRSAEVNSAPLPESFGFFKASVMPPGCPGPGRTRSRQPPSAGRWARALALAGACLCAHAAQAEAPPDTASAPARAIRGVVAYGLVRPLTNAVVYVESVEGVFAPPAEPAQMEQRGRVFVPHVLPVLTGTRVLFPNRDVVRHNVFSPSRGNAFNLGIYLPGDSREVVMREAGVVTLLCNIHEEMSAYVLVLDNPFFARVGAEGAFLVTGVPDGARTLVLWAGGKVVARQVVTVRGGAAVVNFQ